MLSTFLTQQSADSWKDIKCVCMLPYCHSVFLLLSVQVSHLCVSEASIDVYISSKRGVSSYLVVSVWTYLNPASLPLHLMWIIAYSYSPYYSDFCVHDAADGEAQDGGQHGGAVGTVWEGGPGLWRLAGGLHTAVPVPAATLQRHEGTSYATQTADQGNHLPLSVKIHVCSNIKRGISSEDIGLLHVVLWFVPLKLGSSTQFRNMSVYSVISRDLSLALYQASSTFWVNMLTLTTIQYIHTLTVDDKWISVMKKCVIHMQVGESDKHWCFCYGSSTFLSWTMWSM